MTTAPRETGPSEASSDDDVTVRSKPRPQGPYTPLVQPVAFTVPQTEVSCNYELSK